MSSKKGQLFPFALIAFPLGLGIIREFDFKSVRFEKPALVIVYAIAFLMCVYFSIRSIKEKK